MKKLFRVFCLIGIVFFLGMNEGYAWTCDKNMPYGVTCDNKRTDYFFKVHPVNGRISGNEEKIYDAVCNNLDQYSFLGVTCQLICKEGVDGYTDDCSVNKMENKSNIKSFYITSFVNESSYKDSKYTKAYDNQKIEDVKNILEKAKCPGKANCLKYLLEDYCVKYKEEGNSICNTMKKYDNKIEEENVENGRKSCPVTFKFSECGVENVNSFVMYDNGSIKVKDIDSFDLDYNKEQLKGVYSDGSIYISEYINAYKVKGDTENSCDVVGSMSSSKLNFYDKTNHGNFENFKTSFAKEIEKTNDLECPKFVWCGFKRENNQNVQDYYLVLKDNGSNKSDKDICLENKYDGDVMTLNASGDVTGVTTITDEDLEYYYENIFGNLIDKINVISIDNCEDLLKGDGDSEDVIKLLNFIYWAIRIIVPLILIGLGTLDFAKAVFSGDDQMKKIQSKFIKRVIIAVILFLIPSLLKFVLTIADGIWPDIISPDFCGILE